MCQGSIALEYKGLYADNMSKSTLSLHNLVCRKWPQVGPETGLAGGCFRATGLWISSHRKDSKGSLASATCTCCRVEGRGWWWWLTLKRLRQAENPDKNDKGSLAYLMKSSLCDTTFRQSGNLYLEQQYSSQSEWPSLPLPTSFTIKQSFPHCVWWHPSVNDINTPLWLYQRTLLVSGLTLPSPILHSYDHKKFLRISKEASNTLFLGLKTFICSPFTWLSLHSLWISAHVSLLRKCSLTPWLE